MIRFTPTQWQGILGFEVIDPDGWDRSGDFDTDWAKPLSFSEFMAKADGSTCSRRPSIESLKQRLWTYLQDSL